MDVYKDVLDIEDTKIVKVSPLYNNKNVLEFVIQAEKTYLSFSDLRLHLTIVVPNGYIVDNQTLDKLFDSVEIKINNESITSRSCSNEYFLTNFFLTKINRDVDSIDTSLATSGWYSHQNFNNLVFMGESPAAKKLANDILALRIMAQTISSGSVVYRTYKFIGNIATPLARQYMPLPANVKVNVNFKRANANLALLSVIENPPALTEIKIDDCFLEVPFVTSPKLERQLTFWRILQ